MRGHWLSGTRKLNRHYQSGDGGSYRSWEYSGEYEMIGSDDPTRDYPVGMTITAANPLEYPNALYNLKLGKIHFGFTLTDPAGSGTEITVPTRSPASYGAFTIELRYYSDAPVGWTSRRLRGINYAGDPYYLPVEGGTFPLIESRRVGYDFQWVDVGVNAVLNKLADGEYELYTDDSDPVKYWYVNWQQCYRHRTTNRFTENYFTEWVKN